MKPRLVAISGGIGSGKSVVSRVLRALGHRVVDCDTEARLLMDGDAAMRRRIADEVCAGCITPDGGAIDRRKLSQAVFSSPPLLERLNAIVHGAVRSRLLRLAAGRPVTFFETAILYSSGFDALADVIWEVEAPRGLRISRVMARSGLTAPEVERRMASQQADADAARPGRVRTILNDGVNPVLPRIERLLDELLHGAEC